jgi:hypothetical protein
MVERCDSIERSCKSTVGNRGSSLIIFAISTVRRVPAPLFPMIYAGNSEFRRSRGDEAQISLCALMERNGTPAPAFFRHALRVCLNNQFFGSALRFRSLVDGD